MNKKENSNFEKEVQTVLSVPDINLDFDTQLEERLVKKMRTLRTSGSWQTARKFRFSFGTVAAAGIILLAAAVLAIGPERVWAAVRGFGFLPGIGYVQDDVRILDEAVAIQRDDVTVEVFEAVSDSESTWLRVAIRGEQVFPAVEENDCNLPPILVLADGDSYSPNWLAIHNRDQELKFELSFPVIPPETSEAIFVFPCIPYIPSELNAEDWAFTLNFRPPTREEEPLIAEPVFVSTTTPEAAKSESPAAADEPDVQLIVDNVVELDDGYQFQGFVAAAGDQDFSYLDDDLVLETLDGEVIEVEPVFLPFGSTAPAKEQPWAVRTFTKDIPAELVFRLNALGFKQSDETLRSQTLSFDLGESPQIGQTYELDQTINVAGIEVQFNKVVLEQLDNGTYMLILNVEYPQDRVHIIHFLDKEFFEQDESGRGGGGGGFGGSGGGGGEEVNENLHLETIFYEEIPTGLRTIFAVEAYIVSEGAWSTTIQMPAE